jgi:histidinol-phosphate phosphatase family protein
MTSITRRNKPVVFLDRDGVINEDSDYYVKSWHEYHFYPGALAALRRLREAGLEVYLVTNQAGVGKGVFSYRTLLDILLRLQLTVRRHGGLIHGIAYCPHRKEDRCECRKPRSGMLRKLAFRYGLDLSRSVFVGDSCTDVEAGRAVGCTTVFLHTRPAPGAQEHLQRCQPPPDHQADSLAKAVEIIINMPQFSS